eukprot:gene751-biopygen915
MAWPAHDASSRHAARAVQRPFPHAFPKLEKAPPRFARRLPFAVPWNSRNTLLPFGHAGGSRRILRFDIVAGIHAHAGGGAKSADVPTAREHAAAHPQPQPDSYVHGVRGVRGALEVARRGGGGGPADEPVGHVEERVEQPRGWGARHDVRPFVGEAAEEGLERRRLPPPSVRPRQLPVDDHVRARRRVVEAGPRALRAVVLRADIRGAGGERPRAPVEVRAQRPGRHPAAGPAADLEHRRGAAAPRAEVPVRVEQPGRRGPRRAVRADKRRGGDRAPGAPRLLQPLARLLARLLQPLARLLARLLQHHEAGVEGGVRAERPGGAQRRDVRREAAEPPRQQAAPVEGAAPPPRRRAQRRGRRRRGEARHTAGDLFHRLQEAAEGDVLDDVQPAWGDVGEEVLEGRRLMPPRVPAVVDKDVDRRHRAAHLIQEAAVPLVADEDCAPSARARAVLPGRGVDVDGVERKRRARMLTVPPPGEPAEEPAEVPLQQLEAPAVADADLEHHSPPLEGGGAGRGPPADVGVVGVEGVRAALLHHRERRPRRVPPVVRVHEAADGVGRHAGRRAARPPPRVRARPPLLRPYVARRQGTQGARHGGPPPARGASLGSANGAAKKGHPPRGGAATAGHRSMRTRPAARGLPASCPKVRKAVWTLRSVSCDGTQRHRAAGPPTASGSPRGGPCQDPALRSVRPCVRLARHWHLVIYIDLRRRDRPGADSGVSAFNAASRYGSQRPCRDLCFCTPLRSRSEEDETVRCATRSVPHANQSERWGQPIGAMGQPIGVAAAERGGPPPPGRREVCAEVAAPERPFAATLEYAILEYAILEHAILEYAILEAAALDATTQGATTLDGTTQEGTTLEDRNWRNGIQKRLDARRPCGSDSFGGGRLRKQLEFAAISTLSFQGRRPGGREVADGGPVLPGDADPIPARDPALVVRVPQG